MGKYIIKLDDYYMEWTTISDAPATFGMSLDEFKEYYQEEYGNKGMEDLPKRLERIEKYGSSSIVPKSAEDVIFLNRAGYNEKTLSRSEIIEWFCVKQKRPPEHVGIELEYDDDGQVTNHPD